MKKIIPISVLLFVSDFCSAQTLRVINNNPSYYVHFTMYAECTGGGTCTDYIAYSYDVPPSSLFFWTVPCDFEAGGGSSFSPMVGWATSYATTCSSAPAGFEWTSCDFNYI